MKRIVFILIIVIFFFENLVAQEAEHEKKNHLITGALGYTYIPKGAPHGSNSADGVFVPSIGLDYFYSISNRWEIGFMSDFEFGEYIIFEKELNRKNAIVLTVIASYSLTHHINLFAGGGMEFEQHHNLGVIRIGGEYGFELKNDWVIAPGVFFDFKEGTDTWSLSIAFGKEF